MKLNLKYLFTLLFLIFYVGIKAQEDGGKKLRVNRKNPFVKTRIGISPVLGLYFPNSNHTTSARQKMSFCVSIKEEIRLTKHNRDFLWIGAEYMFHGVNFKSYYFYADSLQLYTPERQRFTYDLTFHEIDFPVQLKHSFVKETNTIFSSYVFGGYCYRWLVASQLKVSENGNEIINQAEQVTFKSPAFNPVNSSFLNLGVGFQKNTLLRHNAVFAELQFKYALSPMQFFESYAPSSMYINGHYIYITVGFKL